MKTTEVINLIVVVFISVAPLWAQTQNSPQTKSQPAETAEHAFARMNYESVKQQFEDSKKEYDERLAKDSDCKAFPVDHPVTVSSVDEHMVGCGYDVRKARFIMEKLSEALEQFSFRLAHVDDCLKTYHETIDKKVSDQTTREVENIKLCQSADLFPPPTK